MVEKSDGRGVFPGEQLAFPDVWTFAGVEFDVLAESPVRVCWKIFIDDAQPTEGTFALSDAFRATAVARGRRP